ncbi:hypothetical protein QKK_2049 [Clostridioides difficile DA00191]|uniref:BppU family phage baseplate upper protein n=1 Tax=Clostridioides difficile TaxID=1496 RepID=UPI00038D0A70|nr:hypothetical protein [Clostridioides difficile]EQG92230.1 hypothetical protein QKK_2049 [Clostridioides difficile DA00191]
MRNRDYEVKQYFLEIDFSEYENRKNVVKKMIYSENDINTAFINVQLKNNGRIINLSSYDVIANIWKNTGNKVNTPCDIVNAESGEIEVPLTREALKNAGVNPFTIMIINSEGSLESPRFYYRVEEGLVNDDDIENADEFGVLVLLISQVKEVLKDNDILVTRVENLENLIEEQEGIREANELVRRESEEVRKTSEEAREANELVRKESEEVRETQEIDRQNSIKRMEKELIDKTDEKFNEVDTTLDNKLKEQQKQIDDKIVETNNKINEVDTKIVEVDNKIVEVNTAKTDMTTTVSNKITEFENRFSELESLDARGELMQSREAIDGTVKDTLKDRLTYDFGKVNEKIAEMTSAATNVAFSKSYVESDWVADGEYFKLIVNHNLVTENIFVAILDEATKKSMTNSYTIIDNNTIEIFNESSINVRVTVVNGNTNKEVIPNTINDNITTLDSTYSSVKIDAKFDESLIKINENKSNIATNLEKINLIQNKIGSSELSTLSKNISDAVNELDASVKILEAGGNLGQKLDSLKAKYDALSDKVLDILIYLELESGAVDEVGQWYDNLADSKNILSIDNLRLDTDRRRIFGSEGNVIFNKIDIPFSCYKVKYIHELDDNFIETISNTSTNAGANSIELEKFSYEVK